MGVDLILAGIFAEEKSLFMEKNSSCSDSKEHKKEKSNTFDSRVNKFSQSFCLYLAKEEFTQMCRVQKKKVTRDLFARFRRRQKEEERV